MQAMLYIDQTEKTVDEKCNIGTIKKKMSTIRDDVPVMVQLTDSNGLAIRGQCRVIESSEDGVVLLKGRAENVALSEEDFENK